MTKILSYPDQRQLNQPVYLLPFYMRVKELLIFIVLCSCTIARPIADNTITQDNLKHQLENDDVLRVDKKDGERKKLILDSLEETYLLGHNNEEATMIIPYSLIDEIRVHEVSPGLTVVLVVGVPLALLLLTGFAVTEGSIF